MRFLPLCCIGLWAALGGCGDSGKTVNSAVDTEVSKPAYELEEGQPPAVYENDEGVTLTIVSLKSTPDEPKQALVLFTGVRHPLAGKVVLTKARIATNGTYSWLVDYSGKERLLVEVRQQSKRNMSIVTLLYLPGTLARSRMNFSRDLTQGLEWQDIVQTHGEQVADGSLAKLAEAPRFDLEEYKRGRLDKLEYGRERFEKACGAIPIEVDWANVDGPYSMEGQPCYKGLSVLAKVCKRSLRSDGAIREKTKRIVCESSDKDGFRLDPQGTLHLSSNNSMSSRMLEKQVTEMFGLGQIVIQRKAGGVLVFDPDKKPHKGVAEQVVSYGDGTTMRKQRFRPTNLQVWTTVAWVGVNMERKKNKWVIPCPGDLREFEELDYAQSQKILTKASFEEQAWKRMPVSLSRDQRGQYFYVDRLQEEFGGKDYRVYKGMRGNLQPTQLIDIIDDPSGKVFSTRQGELRLLLGKNSSLWISGKKKSPLTEVWKPQFEDDEPGKTVSKLIYHGLGVYDGQAFGTVCD